MVNRITTTELVGRLEDPEFVVVDVRPIAAFNGWPLHGERHGGHIAGAVPFPLSWIKSMGGTDLESLLLSRGVGPDKTVALYGYRPEPLAPMIERLSDLGYRDVRVYEAGMTALPADPRLPMARLVRYERLVHPAWLHERLSRAQPVCADHKGLVVLHVNSGVPEEYAAGHIPGALHLDTNALESLPYWNRRSPDDLEAALLAHGIRHDTTAVLYGRDSVPEAGEAPSGRNAGQMAAARAAVILMYAGVEDVRLLDGGYDAWVSAGYALEREARMPVQAEAFGVPLPSRPELFLDIPETKALLANPNGLLVSIRSWSEYIGETSGYDYIGPRGRIAGAVWGDGGGDPYYMQPYRNLDNTMRNYHEIEANWRRAGITRDRHVAFYCGSGWRASEAFFCAYLMGWKKIGVFDGGWFEWSHDPTNPIEVESV